MRRILIGAGAIAALALIGFSAWDFSKFSRSIPPPAAANARATSVLVEKKDRRLTLMRDNKPIKSYAVSLGSNPDGHKRQEGDDRTPEGSYKIDFKNQRSRFHLALRISYPETADRESARQRGVPPGSDIMIHGLRNGLGWLRTLHLKLDWTDGCIAVTNTEIEEIWSLVDVGTVIEIRP